MNWRKHIQAAIDKTDGKWSIEDVEERLKAQTAQLFLTDKSAAVLWVDKYPQRSALTVAFGGGELNDILSHIPEIKEYARQLKCDQVDVYGRPGWVKALKKSGFRQSSVTMSIGV